MHFTDASPDKPESYPYGAQTAGLTLRHESAHDEFIAQKFMKGEAPHYSEYDTDMKAMETIRNAWERWERSEFTDNSGYYFIFSLPEGGYILTENKSPTNSTAPEKL